MTARIYRPAKSSMTSGMAKTKGWILDFEAETPRPHDPLMGWVGQTDTRSQVRMTFQTKKAAMHYAAKHGIAALVDDPDERAHRPRAYGDNFAYNRRIPWSH